MSTPEVPAPKPAVSAPAAAAAGTTATPNHPLASRSAVTAYLGVGQLALLTLVVVASLRSLPAMAVFGLGSITLYIVPAILFLVPTALVAAELATGWKGGVYIWIREAMGNRWGFTAVWLQWIQNVVWYPTQLSFIAAALAFVFLDPSLSSSGFFTAVVILVLYWGSTLIALRGGNLFAKLGSWGGILGTLLPAALLIVFGALWVFGGEKSQVPLTPEAVIPPFTGIASIVLIVSNFLAYAGMEVNAVHVNQMKDPGKGFPRSILISAVLILIVFILPTIAIAVAVPQKELGLTNGIMLAFQEYFAHWGVGQWATAAVSALIAAGALASVITWIAGPSKGVLAAAETGLLPPLLQKKNKAGVQSGILMLQGTIVTALAAIFIIVPNVSAAFVALIDMAAALYLIMYMMMFASAMILRRTQAGVKRAYRVPALNFVAGVGFLASLAAFVFAFIPPSGFTAFPPALYPWIVAAVIVVLGVPPLIFYALRRPSWDLRTEAEKQVRGTHEEDDRASAAPPPS
ncbi:amino acid permease [Microbacterium sp. p3-SID336]|uniref:amino acid permease n=1 Tax=Microbacterium sp. p3-SID336 TaxID=2916212 RepID=UPI0021A33A33|nr:amino acid permease [Microbacterium sp. p3-SID336]MCT1478865.1 amino acid permease [Microbacterium sp. p3-SID336]